MLETEEFQAELRNLVQDLLKDPGLTQLQLYVRCNVLLELLDDVEVLIKQNCRRDKLRGGC